MITSMILYMFNFEVETMVDRILKSHLICLFELTPNFYKLARSPNQALNSICGLYINLIF
jgi:hypothetical protein